MTAESPDDGEPIQTLPQPERVDSIVIGGGMAGLNAARELMRAGQRVTVLEKEDQIGGKCSTGQVSTELGPLDVELGAGIVGPYTCPRTIALARELDAPLEWWTPTMKYADRSTGEVVRPDDPTPGGTVRYLKQSIRNRHLADREAGLAGTDPSLATPFSKWATDNGIVEMIARFAGPTSSFGYGYPDEVPAAYYLKYLDLKTMLKHRVPAGMWNKYRPSWAPIGEGPRYKRLACGYGDLAERLGRRLGCVLTGVEVRSVVRDGKVSVTYVQDGEKKALEGETLVLACPLDLASLSFLDASESERELLAKVQWIPYSAAICRISDPVDGMRAAILQNGEVVPPENGDPVLAIGAPGKQTGEICGVYTLARPGSPPEAPLEQRLAKAADFGVNVEDVLISRDWRYFPHVGEEAFRDGFHDEMEWLQGENRTWYAGGLLSFETVERVIAYGQRIGRQAAARTLA